MKIDIFKKYYAKVSKVQDFISNFPFKIINDVSVMEASNTKLYLV